MAQFMNTDHKHPSLSILQDIMTKVNAFGSNPRIIVEFDKYRYVKGIKQKYPVIEYIMKEKGASYPIYEAEGNGEHNVSAVTPAMPLNGTSKISDMVISSGFWELRKSKEGSSCRHKGIDLELKDGDSVCAVWKGTVEFAGAAYGYGNVVYINHGGGIQTRYAHLDKIIVKEGDKVHAGEEIGRGGTARNTNEGHLHFEWNL